MFHKKIWNDYFVPFRRATRIFSSFRLSAENFLMPSDNLSVAIWSSFSIQRNVGSSIFKRSKSQATAVSLLNFFGSFSVLASNSPKSLGPIVNRSQPASALISPRIRYLITQFSNSGKKWSKYLYFWTKHPSQQFCSQTFCNSCRFLWQKWLRDPLRQRILSYLYWLHTY